MDDKKKVEPAELRGKVTIQKPTIGKRMHDAFISQDFKTAAGGVVQDTIVPMIKRIIADGCSNMINRVLFGSKAQNNTSSLFSNTWRYTGWGTGGINYSSISTGNAVQQTQQTTPGILNYSDITFTNREDAEDCLMTMKEILDRYGTVRIADFYEYLKIPTQSTQNNYGWKNLNSVEVEAFRGEWHLTLPKPIPLN